MSDYDRYTDGVSRRQLGAIYRAFKDGKLPELTQAQVSALYNDYDGVRHMRDGGALGWSDQVARIAAAAKLCIDGDYEAAYRELAPVLGLLEVKTDGELLEGLRKAVRAGLVAVTKTATGFVFAGATYDYKDAIKSAYGAKWDKASKSWVTAATAPELAEMERESREVATEKGKRAKKLAKDDTLDVERAALLKRTTADIREVFALALQEHQTEFDKLRALQDSTPYGMEPSERMKRAYRMKELDAVITSLADALANAGTMAEAVSAGELVTAQVVAQQVACWQLEMAAGVEVTRMLGNAFAVRAITTRMDKPKWSEAEIAEVTKLRKGYDSRAWAKLADRDKAETFLRKGIARGLATGEHPTQVAKRLESMFDQWAGRALVIARTEMGRVMSEVSDATYKRADDLGIKNRRRWRAVKDSKTRESHRDLDGEVRAHGEPFKPGIYKPRDGGPAESINCRCMLVPVVDGYDNHPKFMFDQDAGEVVPYTTYREWERQKGGGGASKVATGAVKPEPKPKTVKKTIKPKEPAEKYKPVKTAKEAEDYVSQFVDASGYRPVGVSYAGVHVAIANEVNSAISKFYATFNVPKLGGLAAPAKNTKLGKMINAHAAYSPVKMSLFLNRDNTRKASAFRESLLEDGRVVAAWLEHPERFNFDKMSKRVQSVLIASKASGRALVAETAEEAIFHELGHHIERVLPKDDLERIKGSMAKYAEGISGYAADSVGEYIAESTAAFMKGETIKDPVIIEVFERLMGE